MRLYPLSLLPQLLFLSPLAATLLRVAAACAIFYVANYIKQNREMIMRTSLPIVGNPPSWMLWFSAIIMFLTAAALFFGYWTQAAAIIGAIIAAKMYIGNAMVPSIIPLSRGTSALLFVICVSLILTGAGAFALDLPL